MEPDGNTLASRYHGTLLGAAVADALAFPFRNYSRHFLLSVARSLSWEYETPPGGFHPSGQYTAETQSWIAVIDSILERRDFHADERSAELFVDHMIPLWRDALAIQPDEEVSDVFRRIVRGVCPWNEAALPAGRASAGALGRAIPIGLWNCRNFGAIPAQVETLIGVTHRDPRVLAVSAALAAAISSNATADELILGRLLDRVSEAASAFDPDVAEAVLDMPRILSQAENRALEIIDQVSADANYPPRDDGLEDYSVPILLAALYEFLKHPHDYPKAVDRSIRVGGYNGTTASLTGALVGSFNGVESLPSRLLDGLVERDEIEHRSGELFELRRRLVRESRDASGESPHSDELPDDSLPHDDALENTAENES